MSKKRLSHQREGVRKKRVGEVTSEWGRYSQCAEKHSSKQGGGWLTWCMSLLRITNSDFFVFFCREEKKREKIRETLERKIRTNETNFNIDKV